MTGLDVELAWTYASANDDAGGGSGFAQPAVALKYKLPSMDLSLFVNLTLPFATGDFDVPGLNMGIAPGALYQMTHGKITTILGAQYQLNLEADDVKDGNVLALLAKPSYAVNDKMGVYLWVGYNMYAESEVAGTGAGDESTAFIVGPGVTYTISDKLALEANLPITVADDVNKAWGIWASLYYTLPL
jgi:predicted porin